MTLTKRVIPCLDVAKGRVVKGLNFKSIKDAGDPVAVTAGYVLPEAREEFFSNMDAANVDLKAFSEKFYKKICGGKLAAVLETLLDRKSTRLNSSHT